MKQPLEILHEAKEKFNIDKFVIMFSGGKDSLVTAHYLKDIDFELVYCQTGIGVKENTDYVRTVAEKYGWKLNVITPFSHETYETFVKRFGFPRGGAHNIVMGFLKYHPLRKWYKERQKKEGIKIGLISGRRLNESVRRKRLKDNVEYILNSDKMIMISPLYHWTNEDIWAYIKKEGLELCPAYATLHLGGDCLCGAFGNDEEKKLLSIFHKDTFDEISRLEDKYCGKWGLGDRRSKKRQSQAEANICAECIYQSF